MSYPANDRSLTLLTRLTLGPRSSETSQDAPVRTRQCCSQTNLGAANRAPPTLGREGHALPRSGAMLSFLGLGQIPPQDGHVAAATSCRLS